MQRKASGWRRRVYWIGCGVYWTILGLVTFGPPVVAGWRVTRPQAGHGTISASFGNSLVLKYAMTATNEVPSSGSINVGLFALLVIVPPVIAKVILTTSGSMPQEDDRTPRSLGEGEPPQRTPFRDRSEESSPITLEDPSDEELRKRTR